MMPVKRILKIPVTDKETTKIRFIFVRSLSASASATSFEIATGKPSCVNVIIKSSVGTAIMYKPTPSAPMIRATTMRFTNPRARVINPAIIKINAPFKKDCFVINQPYLL